MGAKNNGRSCSRMRVTCNDCLGHACVTHSKYVAGIRVCYLCVADESSPSAIAARKCANIAARKRVRDNIAARKRVRANKAEKVAKRAKQQGSQNRRASKPSKSIQKAEKGLQY